MRKRAERIAEREQELQHRIEAISRAAAKRFSETRVQGEQQDIEIPEFSSQTELGAEIDKVERVLGLAADKRAEWAEFFHRYFLELVGMVQSGDWDAHEPSFERKRNEICRLQRSAKRARREIKRKTAGQGLRELRFRARQLVILLSVYNNALEEFSAARSNGSLNEYITKVGEEKCIWHCM